MALDAEVERLKDSGADKAQIQKAQAAAIAARVRPMPFQKFVQRGMQSPGAPLRKSSEIDGSTTEGRLQLLKIAFAADPKRADLKQLIESLEPKTPNTLRKRSGR
jgi:hypothetical protein